MIGEIFDPNLIINQIKNIDIKNHTNILDAAKAIMTTDTYPKVSVKKLNINKRKINIYGFAKGSGMIMPNMGTLLVYIFIEADISKFILQN